MNTRDSSIYRVSSGLMVVTSPVFVKTVLPVCTGATKGKSFFDEIDEQDAYALTRRDVSFEYLRHLILIGVQVFKLHMQNAV